MLKNNWVVFFLHICLVFCAPYEEKKGLPASSSSDQITQDSNISGVSAVSVSR